MTKTFEYLEVVENWYSWMVMCGWLKASSCCYSTAGTVMSSRAGGIAPGEEFRSSSSNSITPVAEANANDGLLLLLLLSLYLFLPTEIVPTAQHRASGQASEPAAASIETASRGGGNSGHKRGTSKRWCEVSSPGLATALLLPAMLIVAGFGG
ncbi:hypothetical protein B566_EDAN000997 [Ephemera danica]|nr:hypothetical protein B566_EDAN000997 [Ephemera danica]